MNPVEMVVLIVFIVVMGRVISARYGVDRQGPQARPRLHRTAAGRGVARGRRADEGGDRPPEQPHRRPRTPCHRPVEASVRPDRRARQKTADRQPQEVAMVPADSLVILSAAALTGLAVLSCGLRVELEGVARPAPPCARHDPRPAATSPPSPTASTSPTCASGSRSSRRSRPGSTSRSRAPPPLRASPTSAGR